MKKIIEVLSISIIVFSLIYIFYLMSPESEEIISFSTTSAKASEFRNFPLDKTQFIDLEIDEETNSRLTPRERRDQILDWLLYTTAYATGKSAEQISKILYDIPSIRYGYTHSVANFEYDKLRSCYIGDGRIVALLPEENSLLKVKDNLAHIADKHRKNLGEIPSQIIVFEYKLNIEEHFALLTRTKTFDVHDLFLEKNGYHENRIINLDDLISFMGKIDDITFARIDDKALVLGGRKILSRKYRGIRVEDIAAIWQAEEKIHAKLAKFNQKWDPQINSFQTRWSNKTYIYQWQKEQLEKQRDFEWEQLHQKRLQEQKEEGIVQGSGFSLDPTYDYDALLKYFTEKLEPFLRQLAVTDSSGITLTDVQKAKKGLKNRDVTPFLIALSKLSESLGKDRVRYIVEWIDSEFQFQHARYDGDLKGTEVGMVLFYTDLLAKLWAMDFQNSVPESYIENFNAMTAVPISPVYEQEMKEFSSTRLWFGPFDDGYQIVGKSDSLIFSRRTCRVYAASSNPLEPGVEVAPNAESEAFLKWWNDHYEEIARFEPEYERLNEIMKWSLLISWLKEANKSYILHFLEHVNVKRSNWFLQWVRQKKNLRFKKWDKIHFYQRGYKGITTEALPMLKSNVYIRFENNVWLVGGVSLGSKNLVKARPLLAKNTDKLIRRSNLNYNSTKYGTKSISTLEGRNYTFKTIASNRASVVSNVKEAAKLRGRYSEIANTNFEHIISRNVHGVEIKASIGDSALGNLNISKTTNGFRLSWRSRDIDAGQSLARELSKSSNPGKLLAENPNVEKFIQLSDENNYFVKLHNSEKWLKIAPEPEPTANISKGWQSRVADVSGSKNNLQLAWIDPPAVKAQLSGSGYIHIQPVKGSHQIILINNPARGPPSISKAFRFKNGDITLEGKIDLKTGQMYVDKSKLPQLLKDDPTALQSFIPKTDLQNILAKAPKSQSDVIQYSVSEKRFIDSEGLVRNLKNSSYDKAAKSLAENPQRSKFVLDQHLKEGLQRSDELFAREQFVKAKYYLDSLIEIHGNQPDLMLRRGIAQLRRGDARGAADSLHSIRQGALHNKKAFFDEINARLKQPRLSELERENLHRLAEFADWNELNTLKKVSEGKILPVAEGNKLAFHYNLDDIPNLKPVKGSELADPAIGNSPIYIQDTPALNNINWNVPVHKALQQAVSGNQVVLKLPHPDIKLYKPTNILAPDGVTRLKQVNPSKSRLGKQVRNQFRPRSYDGDSGEDDEEDKMVYFVVSDSTALTPKP